jgi:hypothetical protein
MAVKQGNIHSMNRIGLYYKEQDDYYNAIKYCNMANFKANAELLKYIIDYNIMYNDYDNIIYYSWIGLNAGYLCIVKKLITYLLKHNQIKDVLEVYIICCDNGLYDNIALNKVTEIINIDYNSIMKYYGERYIKLYKLINKYINCNDITTLICTY